MTDLNTNTDTHPQIIKNARLDDIRPGDHITWVIAKKMGGLGGVTSKKIREGIAHLRDAHGDWWTEDGARITDGEGKDITITIRRPVPTPPTKCGDIIEANDGCEFIEAVVDGTTYYAREARLSANVWWAVWRTNTGKAISYTHSKEIITDTWKKSNG